ncbi:CCA tRNA nucleotidyltransferase [Arthrobacter sp. zg-Y1110]|uniref:CCA tRNA nucleotidyltransferase n=1 Tax=Arthrobacter sp. zg-Y1110 TaxID=2886932 RepID=UPI001D13BF0E|nr:HD domain-containing protein [Arthrobacter sp. zg-Y1110]MCC3292497.1 HD domain-containing protein [Arthrobacter sp. zg-Y1110]UWX87071.1 HD domain-containing protein [Arthrobacter sp. zg-Y1110]
MRNNPRRQPAGLPVGGQYAAALHSEPSVEIGAGTGAVIPDLIDLTPEARAVLDACLTTGGRPLIVGGSVRDALLSRETGEQVTFKDVDIEVHGTTADELRAALPGDVNDVGSSFGVLTTNINGQDFDVSLPRRDSKTGDGHRGFTVDLDPDISLEDAFARRDYTMNSMGWDPYTGELIDPFGGRADLADRILRHTRADTFPDDPLRPLRAVQFSARFGLEMDPETLELCRSMKDTVAQLPKDRLWKEFNKLVTLGREPSKGLEALYQTGIADSFPALADVRGSRQDPVWHPEGDVDVHLGLAADAAAAAAERDGAGEQDRRIAVLATLLHDVGKAEHHQENPDGGITNYGHAAGGVAPADEFLKSIGAPNEVREKVLPLIREHMRHTSFGEAPTPSAVRRLMRDLAGENGSGPTIQDWARVVDADLAGRGPGAKPPVSGPWLAVAKTVKVDPPILRGQDLAAAGFPKGQEWGWIVRASLAAQDEGVFSDTDGAVAWAIENREAVIAVERPRWEAARQRKGAIQQARVDASRFEAKAAKAEKNGRESEAMHYRAEASRVAAELKNLIEQEEAS